MTTGLFNANKYSRFNFSTSQSDITVFVRDFGDRVLKQLVVAEQNSKTPFVSFAESQSQTAFQPWMKENYERYMKETANKPLVKCHYLSQMGFIYSMAYSPDGTHIICGHGSGLIQMRHGSTGAVLCTLRNMQFPPKPIYAIRYSRLEERVCYAACMDGNVYRVEIPDIDTPAENPAEYCIRADPATECYKTQFFGAPGVITNASVFINQRIPAQALGITMDNEKMVIGYSDASIKLYDMETQEVVNTYKVHKLRLQFIPKKLQRMHFGQLCSIRCHDNDPFLFASVAWDSTLRIWDTRCAVGSMMTFEGVNALGDSLDVNRENCIVGSWQPTEALTLWDLKARKRISIMRIQNRRPDVDGEYLYACKYWRSTDYNRKGKYAVIGGSGTQCVEVVNLHNRYICCSYPCAGSVLAIASHQERIAFGGTATMFNIVEFHDPKHEKYEPPVEYIPDNIDLRAMIANEDEEESMKKSSFNMPEADVK